MENFGIIVNNRRIEAKPTMTILDACRNAGIYIPSICYYPGLASLQETMPDMSCQLCVVEVDGQVVLSCNTKVRAGMKVETETAKIQEIRRKSITEILRHHITFPTDHQIKLNTSSEINFGTISIQESCTVCPANKQCELQKAIEYIGINEIPGSISKQLPVREDSPFFIRDHNLCINCRKCVRVCADIRLADVIESAFPCHKACPAGIDIPRYIRAVGRGCPSSALAVIREKVPFPGILGRVCIHPCEGECQRGKIAESPLQIRMIKRYAADHGDDSWKKLSKRLPSTGKKVAVVGAGPAGLTAAYYLAKLGHSVVVFESQPKPGGMMLLGIPEYRLPRDILDNEIKEITDVGVEIKTNSTIKSAETLLSQNYNAVFLGLGAHQGIKLGVEGENLPGVMESVEFLRRGNLGEKVKVGQRVGVVGGGNVAIDAARMAIRFGAKKVIMFYRRTREEMPAAEEEIEAALLEGVEVLYLTAPTRVTHQNNTLKLYCMRMRLSENDASGRPHPVPVEDSEFAIELDTLLVAIGQRPDISAELKVDINRGNTIKVDNTMMTSLSGVFSAGDCVSGPASVIEAIAGGRKAAEAIDKYLGGKGDINESLVAREESNEFLKPEIILEKVAKTDYLPVQQRIKSFEEVELGWGSKTAIAEAQRCLRCHVINPKDETLEKANCQFCGACVDACPTGALVERSAAFSGTIQNPTLTTCPYCGVGCQFNIEVKDDKILRVTPADGPSNKGQICVKGKFGQEFITNSERLRTPLIRKKGRLEPASWNEALSLLAAKFAAGKPDEVAVISSSRTSNEDNYVAQKFARAVLGTNNVDNCARV
jgi:formate dehydrogenase (NADP+) beta subunit